MSSRAKLPKHMTHVRVYVYQILRSLAYIHSLGICHRDIKPQNLLVDPETHILKLCDFGSAKKLVHDEPNVSYICSRFYRAPELIFGSVNYTTSIDVWSTGCVMAELMLGKPLFAGDDNVCQLFEIIKILGTPTEAQILKMNPNYKKFDFSLIPQTPWADVFPTKLPSVALDLLGKMLTYDPSERITPLEALAHPFFDRLRNPETLLPNGKPLPTLQNFTPEEIALAKQKGILDRLKMKKKKSKSRQKVA